MAGISRIAYRSRQFWNALSGSRRRVASELLLPHLSTVQLVLFRRMQPSEQAHAFQVLERLRASGQSDPDLLSAALLHDVGKILSPLSVWDRVWIVLGRRLFPRQAEGWAQGLPRGLRRPFVVAAQHPEWGARLAAEAAAAARTVELIQRHQDPPDPRPQASIDRLLAALQAADDEN